MVNIHGCERYVILRDTVIFLHNIYYSSFLLLAQAELATQVP